MSKNSCVKIEQSADGVTVIVPERHEERLCVAMPSIAADQRWNAVVQKESKVVLCERDIRPSEIIVEEGAQLDLISMQLVPHPTNHPVSKTILIHKRAIVRVFTGLFDAVEVHMVGRLVGNQGVFENHVLYFGSNKQMIRMQLHTEHHGEQTMSRTLVRGVVVESAHADMAGTIMIAETGRKTDAHLGHEGLLMSQHGRIDSLPGLEIGTNDVKATHSSAVHYVQPEQLFYLQSRGLSSIDAKRFMIKGFLEEMLATVREPDVLSSIEAVMIKKQELIV